LLVGGEPTQVFVIRFVTLLPSPRPAVRQTLGCKILIAPARVNRVDARKSQASAEL
jgi:hypothetical protein